MPLLQFVYNIQQVIVSFYDSGFYYPNIFLLILAASLLLSFIAVISLILFLRKVYRFLKKIYKRLAVKKILLRLTVKQKKIGKYINRVKKKTPQSRPKQKDIVRGIWIKAALKKLQVFLKKIDYLLTEA